MNLSRPLKPVLVTWGQVADRSVQQRPDPWRYWLLPIGSTRWQDAQALEASVARVAGIVTAIGVVKALQNEIGRRLSLKVLAEKKRGDGSE